MARRQRNSNHDVGRPGFLSGRDDGRAASGKRHRQSGKKLESSNCTLAELKNRPTAQYVEQGERKKGPSDDDPRQKGSDGHEQGEKLDDVTDEMPLPTPIDRAILSKPSEVDQEKKRNPLF